MSLTWVGGLPTFSKNAVKLLDKGGRVDWFRQVAIKPRIEDPFLITLHGVRRDSHYPQLRQSRILTDSPYDRKSVHYRHADIQQQ